MANKEASLSPESYIGSLISLISKSEIRYEGVLYDINAHESSIGLRNVRSFGSEGQKKDGPQVVPSDGVYDYLCFRGTDIKDLQVLSSIPVQTMPAILDDPAIIQSHYQHPVESLNLPYASTSSTTSFSSNSQLGCPSSAFQDSLPQYQPVVPTVSWGPSTFPTVNSNESNMPMYWQGLNGPSVGYSYLEQPPLLRPSPLLLASSRMHQMPHSSSNAPTTSDAMNFSQICLTSLSPSSMSSLNSSFLPPSSASFVNSLLLPCPSSSHVNSPLLSSSSISFQNANVLPTSSASSLNSILLPPSHASHVNSSLLSISGASFHDATVFPPSSASSMNSTFMSISSSALPSGLLIGHAASSVSNEASSFSSYCGPNAPSLTLSSSLPFGTALTSGVDTNKVILQFSEESKLTVGSTSNYPRTSAPTDFIIGTSSSNHFEVPSHSLVTPGQLLQSLTPSPTVLSKSLPLLTAPKDIEVIQTSTLASLSRDAIEAHVPVLPTASVSSVKKPQSYTGNRSRARGMEKMKGITPRHYHGRRSRARGRINTISHSVAKFTDDFDFEAMNEKFNKDELWGELGKSIKTISKENGDIDDCEEVDGQFEGEHEQLKVDIKPAYTKEDFFDSLTTKTFDHKPKKGRSKFSEQKKLDAETFGGLQTNHGGRGGWGGGGGSRYRRGYGGGGRGQGRTYVWSRVT